MSKHAFWQAFIFTIAIFCIGLFAGFFFESARSNSVELTLLNSELNVLDQQVRERVGGSFEVDCDLAVASTFAFADSIYEEAAKLEEYDASNKFPNTLLELHRRYDLLRTMLWVETVELKNRCNSTVHTLVYVYQYNEDDVDVSSQQLYYSRLLYDIKLAHPNEVILIPIAGNTELSSVDLLLEKYSVESLPVIIVDEKEVISDIITFEELEEIIFGTP